MTRPLLGRPLTRLFSGLGLALLGLALVGCVRVPNPNFIADGESGSDTLAESGESSDTLTGDGDGDPSTGDGDGDPTTGDGDGDGDGDCVAGEEGCPCTPLETCNDGLACVLGDCISASSCDPVDDNVQVSATPTYMGGDPPPDPPMQPETFICVLAGLDNGNSATLNVQQCGNNELLQGLVVTVQPKVSPIEDLLGNPNLAATVSIVEKAEGMFIRINANGMDLYYLVGTALTAQGITEYPWAIAPFSSSCGTTQSMCGDVERLAMFIDGGVVFDGNAGQPSDAATAWVEEAIDDCGTKTYEMVLLAY
jgi:hypothetical protein